VFTVEPIETDPPRTLAEALALTPADGDAVGTVTVATVITTVGPEPLAAGTLVAADERPVLAAGEVHMDCPGCGAAWVGQPVRRASASAFCPTCDFPLFLANAALPPPPSAATESARQRLPGVEGREQLGRLACWNCNEPNLPDPTMGCVRCHVLLTPPPPPPAPEIIVVTETQTIVQVELDRRWMWVSAALGAVLLITLTVLALLL
jgi:predicted RNA-binding Zn-ribbon protein involved in translation (DUF1610 family)